MKRKRIFRIGIRLASLLFVVALMLPADTAVAQTDEEGLQESGPSVRRKLLYRSTRLELAPMVGFTVGDPYVRNGIVGATASYYLTNEVGLSLMGGAGLFHPTTSLADATASKLEVEEPDRADNLSFSSISWLAGFEFNYIPVFGKASLFNSLRFSYDLHLLAGFTMVGQTAQAAVDGGQIDSNIEGIKPGGSLGLGLRVFAGDAVAINVQFRDLMYSQIQASTRSASSEFTHNFLMTAGVSFFFPQTVKVSR